jgi:hypothetical protein
MKRKQSASGVKDSTGHATKVQTPGLLLPIGMGSFALYKAQISMNRILFTDEIFGFVAGTNKKAIS